jgi:excisionase family DNA binding protein
LTNLPVVYTKKEVAWIFRISTRRLSHLIREGEIKTITLGKNHQVIPRSEVERYLGQDLRFVDLSGLGFVQKQKQPNTYKPKVRFVK